MVAVGDRHALAARIIAGPGFTGQPGALAHALDEALSGMVGGLEAVADCPSAAVELPDGLAPEDRLARFCDAIALMGRHLLDGLAQAFADAGAASGFAPRSHLGLWHERSAALIDYLEELARVHGVAFASIAAPPLPDAVEATLLSLRHRLEGLAGDALERALG